MQTIIHLLHAWDLDAIIRTASSGQLLGYVLSLHALTSLCEGTKERTERGTMANCTCFNSANKKSSKLNRNPGEVKHRAECMHGTIKELNTVNFSSSALVQIFHHRHYALSWFLPVEFWESCCSIELFVV